MGKGLRTGTRLSVLSLPRLWRGSLPFTKRGHRKRVAFNKFLTIQYPAQFDDISDCAGLFDSQRVVLQDIGIISTYFAIIFIILLRFTTKIVTAPCNSIADIP